MDSRIQDCGGASLCSARVSHNCHRDFEGTSCRLQTLSFLTERTKLSVLPSQCLLPVRPVTAAGHSRRFGRLPTASAHLALRHIHDQARRQIKPRHDGLQLHILGVVRAGSVDAQAGWASSLNLNLMETIESEPHLFVV